MRVTVATTGQQVSPSEARELGPQDAIWVPPKRVRSARQRAQDMFVAVSQGVAVFLVIREATK